MLEAAIAAVGATPQATAMIGDTAYDMAMAQAADAHAVGVAWGYHSSDELRAAGAEAIAETPGELAAILKGLR
jgi:phosphoglycolate phosphatase